MNLSMDKDKPKKPANALIPQGTPLVLEELAAYQEGSIVSRILLKTASGSVTLFAFDKNQALSEHTTPFEALAHMLEGEAEFIVGDKAMSLKAGQLVWMPANIPHALKATTRFKMLLTMLSEVSL